jgi:hypothetical protein
VRQRPGRLRVGEEEVPSFGPFFAETQGSAPLGAGLTDDPIPGVGEAFANHPSRFVWTSQLGPELNGRRVVVAGSSATVRTGSGVDVDVEMHRHRPLLVPEPDASDSFELSVPRLMARLGPLHTPHRHSLGGLEELTKVVRGEGGGPARPFPVLPDFAGAARGADDHYRVLRDPDKRMALGVTVCAFSLDYRPVGPAADDTEFGLHARWSLGNRHDLGVRNSSEGSGSSRSEEAFSLRESHDARTEQVHDRGLAERPQELLPPDEPLSVELSRNHDRATVIADGKGLTHELRVAGGQDDLRANAVHAHDDTVGHGLDPISKENG